MTTFSSLDGSEEAKAATQNQVNIAAENLRLSKEAFQYNLNLAHRSLIVATLAATIAFLAVIVAMIK